MLHRDLDRCVAVERQRPGDQLVEHDAERVEIRALVDVRAARLLGREVLRGADDRSRLRHLRRAGARDAEVGHLDPPLAVDEDVVRLDVAVDEVLAVRDAQCGEDLARVVDRDRDRRGAAGGDQLLQAAPVEVLHRDVVGALGLPAVEDRDDVRVREARCVLRLAAEALDELLVVRVPVVQDLDRDPAAQFLVLGEVDVRHAAGAKLAHDLIATIEEGADERVRYGHGSLTG